MKMVLIYGSGRLGIQVYNLLRSYFSKTVKVMGFIDDTKPSSKKVINGLLTVGAIKTVRAIPKYSPRLVSLVFAIGYSDMGSRRKAFSDAARSGYRFLNFVHPSARVEPTTKLGRGTIVQAGAVVDHGTQIGEACYIDIGVLVSEFCKIGDNNFIAAGTTIGGYTSIGHSNFIGMNSTVVDNLTMGDNNLINAQTLVYKPLQNNKKLVEFHEQHETLK